MKKHHFNRKQDTMDKLKLSIIWIALISLVMWATSCGDDDRQIDTSLSGIYSVDITGRPTNTVDVTYLITIELDKDNSITLPTDIKANNMTLDGKDGVKISGTIPMDGKSTAHLTITQYNTFDEPEMFRFEFTNIGFKDGIIIADKMDAFYQSQLFATKESPTFSKAK